jgi:hypothetical protein
MKIARHPGRSRSLRYYSALSAHIIIVARHLDHGLSILAVAADPTEVLPLLSCSIPRTGYHTSRNTGRRRYAGTRTSLPVDRHGHRADFSTWTFTRQHRGRRYADSTRTPRLPGRMLSLHKRRHVTVRSPEWVFAEIRCYPSPARSRARQPKQTREVASFDGDHRKDGCQPGQLTDPSHHPPS